MLNGGFPSGEVSLIYGEAGTGKSTLALQTALTCARLGFEVFLIDIDEAFSVDRLRQIALYDFEEVSPLFGVFSPPDFYEQTILVEALERLVTPRVGLVVLDTVNRLYRLAITGLKQATHLNKELNRQLAYLARLARNHNIPLLLTSQVRGVFEEGLVAERSEPVASRALNYWAENIVALRSALRPNARVALLEKYRGRSLSNLYCHLQLGESGFS